ncbi:toll/interleukin-1 receptor domain-containing protein [Novipirellula caenicola]|uniref:TIR domain-containing protein n=1 Tax=Novipirellula caenicola TaxID=1536901 RepID=A0ABP9VLX6_9BACT
MPESPKKATPTPAKAKRVYVSHSEETRDLARFVSQKLRDMGIDASSDDLETHQETEQRRWLKEEIGKSDAVVTLVTPNSLDSNWMQYEVGLATGLDRLVIPVVVDVKAHQLPEQIAAKRTLGLDQLDQIREMIGEAIAQSANE